MKTYTAILAICFVQFTQQQVLQSDDSQSSTRFSIDLYKSNFNANENTVISPISFRILLSILYQSAYDTTETELRDKLYLAGDKQRSLQTQKISIEKLSQSPSIKIVNKIFLKKEAQLNENFQKSARELRATVENIDFRQKQESATKINQWVEEQTNGLIKNLVTPDTFTDDMALLLLNTIYFKAKWLNAFEKTLFKNTFTGIDNVPYSIDFMSDSGYYNYSKSNTLNSEVLELPYVTESNFVFWIILPNKESNLREVKALLTSETLKNVKSSMNGWSIDIGLPKFEIESTIDGKKLLRDYGIQTIFDRTELNLLNGDNKIKVDDVKQKTKITVNTDGTEAATSTFIKAVTLSARPILVINRPFMFAVMTADTLEPVFMGHFVKPNTV